MRLDEQAHRFFEQNSCRILQPGWNWYPPCWVVTLQLYPGRIYVLILLSKTVKAHPGFRDRVVGMISSHLSD